MKKFFVMILLACLLLTGCGAKDKATRVKEAFGDINVPSGSLAYHYGGSLVVNCPECHYTVTLSQQVSKTKCPNCDAKFSIRYE